MRGKAVAGLAIVVLAILAFTAIGLGRDGGGATAEPGRHETVTVDHKRAGDGGIRYVVGAGAIQSGNSSLTIKACAKNFIVINGFLAAQNPADSGKLTIRGSGPTGPRQWFVDYGATGGTSVDAVFGLVCKKTG